MPVTIVSDVPQRREPEFRHCLLGEIHAHGGMAVAEDLRPPVAKAFHFTPLPKQSTKWKTNVSFALIDLRDEGLLESPFGEPNSPGNRNWILGNRPGRDMSQQVWRLTSTGRSHVIAHLASYAVPPTEGDAAEQQIRFRPRGQGFGLTSTERRAVERHAMALAIHYFKKQWDSVVDVSSNSSFDLHCCRGAEVLRVEVKGTMGLGEEIILTKNEAREAAQDGYALFVVSEIELVRRPGHPPSTTGGVCRLFSPWLVKTEWLSPIAYTCHLDQSAALIVANAGPA